MNNQRQSGEHPEVSPKIERKWRIRVVVAASMAATALCGCQTGSGGGRGEGVRPELSSQPEHHAPTRPVLSTVGRSIEDRPIRCRTFGDGPQCVLFIASIHGDETAGTPLLNALADHLQQHGGIVSPDQRIVLVPIANPDGEANHRRTNMHGVDLNRNFPTANFHRSQSNGAEPLSQPESQALYDLITELDPACVVTIHQPLSCIDYDGPGREIVERMAAACGLPVRKLGARPGSLGSYVGVEMGVPIITIELPRRASRYSYEELWETYGEMLLAAIRHR